MPATRGFFLCLGEGWARPFHLSGELETSLIILSTGKRSHALPTIGRHEMCDGVRYGQRKSDVHRTEAALYRAFRPEHGRER